VGATQERTLEAVRGKRLILIEAPSSAYPSGMLSVGNITLYRGGALLRFSTPQPPLYCDIDLHARPMYVGILSQDGAVGLHRNMPARPDALLQAMAPSRDDLVLAVAWLFTSYWLAALGAHAGRPFVLGPALSRPARHGGKAKNDKSASQTSAVLLRGGRLPQASVSPAAMRATRNRRRRRRPLRRTRAQLLALSQQTHSQDKRPAIGKKRAYQGKRDGGAARCLAPAVPKRGEVALALMDHDAWRLRAVERPRVPTAQPPQAPALSRRPAVPGIGKLLPLVLRYELPESPRCPRGQEGMSYGRWGQCAQASAGPRYGTSGKKLGNASRTWAFAEAAVLWRRHYPQGQQRLARWETKHGQGQALTRVAPKVARTVSARLTRATVVEMDRFLNGYASRGGEPDASLAA
jgi:hypothetical protein